MHLLIDYTTLKPDLSREQILAHCATALERRYFAVCIPPYFVALAAEALRGSEVKVCTVVGFPLGMHDVNVKLLECDLAIRRGAREIDLMYNLAAFKSGDLNYVRSEIRRIRILTQNQNVLLKVIIESGALTTEELQTICAICADEEPDFVKTSTGFIKPGAETDKVAFMRRLLPESILIKASGGVRTLEQAQSFIQAGASRIGTSANITVLP